ncbi:HD domain-containing protein [Candidatus Dojkabacteria bacterium]|nr:HD domain-containing protein [Candidatus Dojkabacteria bacterium]
MKIPTQDYWTQVLSTTFANHALEEVRAKSKLEVIHAEKVNELAQRILINENMDKKLILPCEVMCKLHDIGKASPWVEEGEVAYPLRHHEFGAKLLQDMWKSLKLDKINQYKREIIEAISLHSSKCGILYILYKTNCQKFKLPNDARYPFNKPDKLKRNKLARILSDADNLAQLLFDDSKGGLEKFLFLIQMRIQYDGISSIRAAINSIMDRINWLLGTDTPEISCPDLTLEFNTSKEIAIDIKKRFESILSNLPPKLLNTNHYDSYVETQLRNNLSQTIQSINCN